MFNLQFHYWGSSELPMCQSRSAGFTLVELMITIAIAAILLAIALPSFQGSMRSNRLATSTNEMIATISLARSEAIRSRRGAGLCATANGSACGTDWNQGWMVWADANGDGAVSTGETVVRHVQAVRGLNVVAGSGTIVFNNRGGPSAATSFTMKPSDCPASQQLVNTLRLNGSGQVKTEKSACP